MKIKFGREPWVYPVPMALAGAMVQGRANFETVGDTGIMGLNPPLIYLASHQDHFTNIGILATNVFSINLPSIDLLDKLDHCGMVSGRDHDKAALFKVFFGDTGAPMIDECPVNLEAKVVKEFSIQHRQIFIGEVVQTWVAEEFLVVEGENRSIAGLEKLQPIMYALDNHYYSIGKTIGIGYQEGKKIQSVKIH